MQDVLLQISRTSFHETKYSSYELDQNENMLCTTEGTPLCVQGSRPQVNRNIINFGSDVAMLNDLSNID